MNLIEGFSPDDDEQTLEARVSNHLRIMGLNDAFGYGDWYTTRLGPIVEGTASRIVDYYFDRLRESTVDLIPTAAIEEGPSPNEAHVAPAASEPETEFLNYHFMEHALKNIDGWSESWTTEAEFSDFLLTHWAETYGFQVPKAIAEASTEAQLMEFLQFVHYYREAFYSKAGEYKSPYPEKILTEDYNDFLPLLALLNPAPLNDLQALLQALGIENEADAISVLRPKVELVYSRVGKQLPTDWTDLADPIRLANMQYEGLRDLVTRLNTDWDFKIDFGLDKEFHDGYLRYGYHNVYVDFDVLAGVDRSADLGLFMFLLSFWEPADYVITPPEIVGHIANREWVQAGVNAGLLLAPGLSGKMDNAADLIRRFDAVLNIPGAKWVVQRHDLLGRGFPEQAVDDIMAGRATRPRWGAGHGKYHDADEKIVAGASESIRLEFEAGKFLGNDLGYEVFYLLPDSPSEFRTHVHTVANYQGRGRPDFFITHLGEDGQAVLREFDVYSPTTVDFDGIFQGIKDKVRVRGSGEYRQADRIVLNLARVDGDVNLKELQRKLAGWDISHLDVPLKEVIVIDKIDRNYDLMDIWTFNG